jgi:hypothetical protein
MPTQWALVLASALISVLALAHAQQASESPPADLVKQAREAGFKPEVRNGVTVFCWNDADIGSRLSTKKCVREAQLRVILDRRQAQRDALQTVPTAGVAGH